MTQYAVPVLPAINIRETISFYEKKLGFSAYDHGAYVIMEKNGIRLHLFQSSDKYLCENSQCFIHVNNIEDLYVQFSAMDIIYPKGKLEDKSWGMKEFSVLDNNGNLLRFGEES